jgi:hypothetical protein
MLGTNIDLGGFYALADEMPWSGRSPTASAG